MTTAPAFRTGSEEAEKAAERTSFARTKFLTIENGHFAIVRMLTDHNKMITVGQHNNSPTRPVPADFKGNWPKAMTGVCRNDPAFAGMYDGCYLCDKFAETGDKRAYKPGQRSWALGVAREKIVVEGKTVGMQDVMIEVEVDGVKSLIPQILVMNFAWGNFWGGFAALQQMNGTWCDRDLHISRKGTELDTAYAIAGYEPVHIDGFAKSDAPLFDTRDMGQVTKYITALGLKPSDFETPAQAFHTATGIIVAERASDDYFARFFDVTKAVPADRHSGDAPTHDKPQGNEPTAAELQEIAARVSGYPTAAAPAALPVDAPEADDAPPTLGFG